MKRKKVVKRRVTSKALKRRHPRKLHHKIISLFKGDGGIYVIFILATVMAGALALTGGLVPKLNPAPTAADQVTIDPDSAKQSSESALQLVDIKIKPTATPTVPPLTNTPTPTPEQDCLDRTVITMLIDLSASMLNDGKDDALNSALGDFTDALYQSGGKTTVSALGFGAGGAFSYDGTAGVRLIMGYTSNKDTIKSRLTTLDPGASGGTYTRDAFSVALSRISDYKSTHTTGNNRYVTILFTDGVPENALWDDADCYKVSSDNNVCWSRTRDPRATPYSRYSTDLTARMKSANAKVYSIGIYDSTPGTRGSSLTTDLQTMLKTIASKTTSPYYQSIDLRSGNVRDLTKLFTSIVGDVCAAS